jgi:hypothetical protein
MTELHSEPVSSASQLAVLPFLAAVEGYLREAGEVNDLRITMYRTTVRDGVGYLQQVCPYLRQDFRDWQRPVGRVFAVDQGIMGAAYRTNQVWHTPHFENLEDLKNELRANSADPEKTLSWFAIPFLGPQYQVVLILYAQCKEFGLFADLNRVRRVVAMGQGFCRLFDGLQRDPLQGLQNYPLSKGTPRTGAGGAYTIQQPVNGLEPPRFKEVQWFNYEATVG